PERRRRLGGGRLGRRTREEAEEDDEPGPGEGRAEGDAAAEGVAEEAVLGGALRRGVRRAGEAVAAGDERLVGGGGHREGLRPRDEAEGEERVEPGPARRAPGEVREQLGLPRRRQLAVGVEVQERLGSEVGAGRHYGAFWCGSVGDGRAAGGASAGSSHGSRYCPSFRRALNSRLFTEETVFRVTAAISS